jgi:hypothetical protein
MPQIAIRTGDMLISGASASCPFTMVLTFGSERRTYSGTCTFVREQGQWYIMTMQ